MGKKQRTAPRSGNCRVCNAPTNGNRGLCAKHRGRNGHDDHQDKYAGAAAPEAPTPTVVIASCTARHRSGVVCIHPEGHWGAHEGFRQRHKIMWDAPSWTP